MVLFGCHKSKTQIYSPKEAKSMDSQQQILDIPVGKVQPSPFQPRHTFRDEDMAGLVSSIRESGLIQPIIVRVLDEQQETYELVAGERRLRAHKILQKPTIQAVVKRLTDEEARDQVLVENIQREGLTLTEEAQGLRDLVTAYQGSVQRVSDRIGKSVTYINDRLILLDLPTEVQLLVDKKEVNASHAKVILELQSTDDQIRAAEMVKKLNLSVNQLRGRLQKKLSKKTPGASGKEPGVVKFDKVNRLVVWFFDALQGFDFSSVRDPKKQDTMRNQLRMIRSQIDGAMEKLAPPAAPPPETAQADGSAGAGTQTKKAKAK